MLNCLIFKLQVILMLSRNVELKSAKLQQSCLHTHGRTHISNHISCSQPQLEIIFYLLSGFEWKYSSVKRERNPDSRFKK